MILSAKVFLCKTELTHSQKCTHTYLKYSKHKHTSHETWNIQHSEEDKNPTLEHQSLRRQHTYICIIAHAMRPHVCDRCSQGGLANKLFLGPLWWCTWMMAATEKNHPQLKKGLAVVCVVKKFHNYLYSHPFLIESDHQPLSFLFDDSETNSTNGISSYTAHSQCLPCNTRSNTRKTPCHNQLRVSYI